MYNGFIVAHAKIQCIHTVVEKELYIHFLFPCKNRKFSYFFRVHLLEFVMSVDVWLFLLVAFCTSIFLCFVAIVFVLFVSFDVLWALKSAHKDILKTNDSLFAFIRTFLYLTNNFKFIEVIYSCYFLQYDFFYFVERKFVLLISSDILWG